MKKFSVIACSSIALFCSFCLRSRPSQQSLVRRRDLLEDSATVVPKSSSLSRLTSRR